MSSSEIRINWGVQHTFNFVLALWTPNALLYLFTERTSLLSLSMAYPSGKLGVPDIILQEQKGTHDICRHFRYLLTITEQGESIKQARY